MRKLNETVICADGFEMSVQANESAYCSPRVNNAERYLSCEIGFPSKAEDLILHFAEEPSRPTETVYGYVPSQTVALVIAKHGGMISGEVPAGVPELMAPETQA